MQSGAVEHSPVSEGLERERSPRAPTLKNEDENGGERVLGKGKRFQRQQIYASSPLRRATLELEQRAAVEALLSEGNPPERREAYS